jgi:cytoskeletal protein CcmA (bactofilin family)
MIKPGETATVIGRTARLQGEIHCADDLQIEGEFDGTIRLTGGRVTVGAEARVRGNISAPDVVICGSVEGDIHAKGRVDLRSSAVVLGDVFASRISMEENAVLQGQVDPSRAGEEEPLARRDAGSPLSFVPPQPLAFPEAIQIVSGKTQEYAAIAVSEEHVTTPPVLTQSGRQLPMALAAFAAGARQDTAIESGAYRKESSEMDEDVLWSRRTVEE